MDDDEAPRQPPKDPGEVSPETEAIQNHWEEVMEDMEYTAGEYRKEGFDVLEVHPGDVVALGPGRGERWGLDLLVPDDEFDQLHEWVEEEGGNFGGFDVYRAQGGSVTYVVVAMKDERNGRVVIFPAYFDPSRAGEMLDTAQEVGEMRTHLRPLSEHAIVTFVQAEPSLFTA